jgi:adenylate kinase family enzyme
MSLVDTAGLKRVVSAVTDGVPYWGKFFDSLGSLKNSRIGIHLAIFVEPYLEFVLEGKKTVESRFSVNRVAPYGRVGENDVIFLKRAGGPIVGICEVTNAWFYKLGPDSFGEIATRFGRAICPVGEEFWEERRHAEYATLIKLGRVHRTEPLAFPKKDRRGWVVLKPSELQDELFMQPIVVGLAGPIASGKTTIGRELADSLGVPFGSFGRIVRMVARNKGISESRENLQRLGQQLVEQDPVELCREVLDDAGWQPGTSVVIEGFRHLSIVDALRQLVRPVPFRLVYVDVDLQTELVRTSLSSAAMKQYRADPTEIELPNLKKIADLCVSGAAPASHAVSRVRKAIGLNNGE